MLVGVEIFAPPSVPGHRGFLLTPKLPPIIFGALAQATPAPPQVFTPVFEVPVFVVCTFVPVTHRLPITLAPLLDAFCACDIRFQATQAHETASRVV